MDLPSDIRDTKRMKSSAGVSHVLQDKNFVVELSSERKKGEKSQNEINSTSFVELLSKSEQSTQCQGMKTVGNGKSKVQAITGTMDASNSGSSNIFKGRKFCFSTSFPHDRVHFVLISSSL